ncbi:MAG: iron chelate uptake ABC transporter family permease subunit [Aeromicrobium sp.]
MSLDLRPAAAPSRHLVARAGSFSIRLHRRSMVVGAVIAVGILGLAVVALLVGDYPVSAGQALQALVGRGSDPLAIFFVQDQRAPRIVCAVLVGAALAMSGAIFQSLSGNPLGSPDVIGFTSGAATGALLQIILLGGGAAAVSTAALVGGIGTAVLIYALAWRGGLTGYRLVLVGIGVAAMLQALNGLLVVRASLDAAQTATQWLAGSFNASSWTDVTVIGLTIVILVPMAAALARQLSLLAMGDDVAHGLGVDVERTRLGLVAAGVGLVAMATAVCGPIVFIALAAPQLARRLTRSTTACLGPSALMGGALVLASDLIAQRLFAPTQLAVGIVSGSLGGVYLIWLLAIEWRKGQA